MEPGAATIECHGLGNNDKKRVYIAGGHGVELERAVIGNGVSHFKLSDPRTQRITKLIFIRFSQRNGSTPHRHEFSGERLSILHFGAIRQIELERRLGLRRRGFVLDDEKLHTMQEVAIGLKDFGLIDHADAIYGRLSIVYGNLHAGFTGPHRLYKIHMLVIDPDGMDRHAVLRNHKAELSLGIDRGPSHIFHALARFQENYTVSGRGLIRKGIASARSTRGSPGA